MPSITINISGVESRDDLFEALMVLLGDETEHEDEAVTTENLVAEDIEAESPPDYMPATDNVGEAAQLAEAAPRPTRGRRGRPKKEEATGPLPGQEEFPFVEDAPAAAQSEETPKEPTLDDAKDAGRKLLMALGADSLRELLGTYGLRKVGDLPFDKLKKFISDCKQLMEQDDV